MAKKITVRMEMNRVQRNLFDEFGKALLVLRLLPEAFLQLAAPDECKGGIDTLMARFLSHDGLWILRVSRHSLHAARLFQQRAAVGLDARRSSEGTENR
jgi:hypothetical protein